jgi:hypothetical protein
LHGSRFEIPVRNFKSQTETCEHYRKKQAHHDGHAASLVRTQATQDRCDFRRREGQPTPTWHIDHRIVARIRFEVAAKYRSRPNRNFRGRRAFEDHLPKMPSTFFIIDVGALADASAWGGNLFVDFIQSRARPDRP